MSSVHFHLEHPPPGRPVRNGPAALRGWMTADLPLHFVDLRVRAGERILPGIYGLPRRDLAEHFGANASHLPAGFEVGLDLDAGAFDLTFEALGLSGEWVTVHSGTFLIEAGDGTPPHPAQTLRTHEFERALNLLWQRIAHEPTTPLDRLAAQLAAEIPFPSIARNAHRPFEGHFDEPAAIVRAGFNRIPIIGWCFHQTESIRRMFASADLQAWQTLRRGDVFDGVGDRFPAVPEAERSRVAGLVDVPSQLPNPVAVRIYAELSDGSWHLCGIRRTMMLNHEQDKQPLAPFSTTILLRAARALHVALRARRVPLEGGLPFLRTLIRTGADLRARSPKRPSPPGSTPYPSPDTPGQTADAGLGSAFSSMEAGCPHPADAASRLTRHQTPPFHGCETATGNKRGGGTPPPADPDSSEPGSGLIRAERPPRLTLVSHNLNFEGAPLFLWELARAIHARLNANLIVVSGRDGPLADRFRSLGADIRLVDASPLDDARDPAGFQHNLERIGAAVVSTPADLVVANTLSSYWAVHGAAAAGIPSLFYIHESTPPAAFFHRRLSPGMISLVEETFTRATRVSFLTEATRKYFDPLGGGDRFVLNPGWIDLQAIDAFRSSRPRDEVRARLGIAPGQFVVVNVGTICDRKGQTLFARAVDWFSRRDPETAGSCRFLMIGGRNTSYDRDLADFLRDLNRLNLETIPETGDVYDYYHAADLFVCTSFEESFPRVILEAMAFGLPIVSTDVHGIPEIARHEREAILVPAGDTYRLTEAMRSVAMQPELGRKLSAAARSRVETTFTTNHILPRHLTLIESLIPACRD